MRIYHYKEYICALLICVDLWFSLKRAIELVRFAVWLQESRFAVATGIVPIELYPTTAICVYNIKLYSGV